MKLLTGLFHIARKRLQTTDGEVGFREKIDELVAKRDSLSPEGVNEKIDELKAQIDDLPDSEDKEKLDRFLEDFRAVKEQDESSAKEAGSMIADLFEKLDGAAMSDEVKTDVEETQAPDTSDENGAEGEEAQAKGEPESATEPVAKDGDADKEEIYQYIKKRLAEDACKDGGENVETKKEEEVVTTDNAPRIAIQMNDGGKVGENGLRGMFTKMKNGGR